MILVIIVIMLINNDDDDRNDDDDDDVQIFSIYVFLVMIVILLYSINSLNYNPQSLTTYLISKFHLSLQLLSCKYYI